MTWPNRIPGLCMWPRCNEPSIKYFTWIHHSIPSRTYIGEYCHGHSDATEGGVKCTPNNGKEITPDEYVIARILES